jgi:hypothetical protein
LEKFLSRREGLYAQANREKEIRERFPEWGFIVNDEYYFVRFH